MNIDGSKWENVSEGGADAGGGKCQSWTVRLPPARRDVEYVPTVGHYGLYVAIHTSAYPDRIRRPTLDTETGHGTINNGVRIHR